MIIIILEILLVGLHLVKCQEGDGFTDENRPYKFGFNIEGYQHRYEEKNEKGIIMGEYGFITADGVYHLTVYATDENGNFKIIKMKNIKIGLPTEKPMTSIPGVAGGKPHSVNQIKNQPEQIKLDGKPGCGGCLLPTPKPPEKESSKVEPLRGSAGDQVGPAAYAGKPLLPEKYPVVDSLNPRTENPGEKYKNQNEQFITSNPASPGFHKSMKTGIPGKNSPSVDHFNPRLEKPGEKDKNRDKFDSNLGSQEGEKVPESVQDLMKLFYKFNYTLTYHGHDEVGNRAGEKNGSYFFNGRDGYKRKVNYTANEFGYQPNITLVRVGQDETPEEGSEKELNKLLGNEFVWYYQ
ncbi:protein lethal(3)malignant blood neoplasm 1 [Cimex lectularius]|uniref:CPR type cuticle protein n=1 Tax=Cimex lectularius TaxID=79782 RepID=A0A8I6RYJ9_CIMLE|nr:protein lethal(3)malignant blood neoplasm 1 [Cimex lectularius]